MCDLICINIVNCRCAIDTARGSNACCILAFWWEVPQHRGGIGLPGLDGASHRHPASHHGPWTRWCWQFRGDWVWRVQVELWKGIPTVQQRPRDSRHHQKGWYKMLCPPGSGAFVTWLVPCVSSSWAVGFKTCVFPLESRGATNRFTPRKLTSGWGMAVFI